MFAKSLKFLLLAAQDSMAMCGAQVLFQGTPQIFYGVQVRAFRGRWPPINAMLFKVMFNVITPVLGIVVHLESMPRFITVQVSDKFNTTRV